MQHLQLPIRALLEQYQLEATALDQKFNTFKNLIVEQNHGAKLRDLLISRSKILDRCLGKLWKYCDLIVESNISLFAVGGYGRREVFPASDIDILILHDQPLNKDQKVKLERFIQLLWDIGTPIGQSVRSITDCLMLANEDHTILTNLLNSRKIVSNKPDFLVQLKQHLETSSPATSKTFFRQKKQEWQTRHRKHADTEYNLEPNIKEAPGGLRDIHTLIWICKYTLGLGSLTKLVNRRILNREELDQLQLGYDFIASVRYCLHVLVGRDENRLLFDYQKKVAQMLGFTSNQKNQAVEQFMKTYYRHASTIAAVVDLVLENVEEELLTDTATQSTTHLSSRFTLIDHKIAVTHDDIFQETPSAILELFYLLGQSPAKIGVRANIIRLLRKARHQINDRFRSDPANTRLFLQILQSPYRLCTQLKRMKRYGILGRYLPEFGQVVGQMQYDLFHVYTVDAHALLVVQNMRLLRHTEARQSFPLASKILHTLSDRTLLYIAGLFHDIAKGRGGDHSILGADDVKKFCERHQLSESNSELIIWLVLDHLIMSMTAQKMDISDELVVKEFAHRVGDQERLDYLYLLTICDIGATNPKLLNPWRLSLLNQLYFETRHYFKRQLDSTDIKIGRTFRIQDKAASLLREAGIHSHQYAQLWHEFGANYFSRYSAHNIAWHTEEILQHADLNAPLVIAGLTQESSAAVYTQIFVYMKDCDYLFVNSVAVLSDLGLNILDARVLTSKNDYSLNTYIVDDDNTGIIASTPQIYTQICNAMKQRLATRQPPNQTPTLCLIPRTHKHFDVQTQVQIHSLLSRQYTIIQIETLDRPGLLAIVGAVFVRHGLALHSAKVLTFGERAEDYFHVTYDRQPIYDLDYCRTVYQDLLTSLQF